MSLLLAACAGVLAGLAYLTRQSALVMIVAGPLYLLARRKPRHAALFALAMMPFVAGWALWVKLHSAAYTAPGMAWYGDYARGYASQVTVGDVAGIVYNNIGFLAMAVGGQWMPGLETSWWGVQAMRLMALLCVAGVVRMARSDMTPYHWYALGSVPLLLAWHYPPNTRFLVPLVPLMLAGMWVELKHIAGLMRSTRGWGNRTVALGIACAVIGIGAVCVHATYQYVVHMLPGTLASYRPARDTAAPTYDWVRGNVPRDAVVVAYNDTLLWLHTGRHAIRPAYSMTGGARAVDVVEFAHIVGAQYVVALPDDFQYEMGQRDQARAVEAVRRDAGLEAVYRDSVLRVRREASYAMYAIGSH